jgi:hypothetical protein
VSSLWYRHLGHPGHEALPKQSSTLHSCTRDDIHSVCHACQLGHHVRLPFHASNSHATNNFDIIHCDLWTSLVISVFGYKYYLVIPDDCSHYLWTFPLKLKSDMFSTLSHFFTYVLSSAPPSRQSSATMDVSLITPAPARSSSPMAPTFVCHAPTPPPKTVKPSASFDLLTT